MKLKTWQKWGIAFGVVHVLVCMVFLYLRRYDIGHPSIMVLLLIIDTPIAIIGKYFFGRLFYNNEYFYFYYLLIAGTLFYFVIGVIVGQILKLIKHSRMDFKTNHIGCSVILLTLLISNNLFAYSGPDHHRHMGVRAADESDLDTYLKDNLGFSKGINTTLTNPDEPGGEQTKKIFEWIGYGSEMEDVPPTRADNHFYDPVTNQGLSDYPHWFPVSSRVWAREHEDNDYSWAKARENYYLALTSRTKEERERYWALTFRSLGQVLHLVQDLASPAHVRNDNHGPVGGFPNESLSSWDHDAYEDTWGTSPEGISFIHPMLAHGALGNADYQYPAVQLNRFEDYWDSEDGKGLAEFTNSNFVSKDTNVDVLTGRHHYDNPRPTGLYRDPDLFEFADSDGVRRRVNVTYYTSNVVDNYAPGRSVNPFNYLTAVSYWNFYTMRYDPTRIHYTLNRKCHEEYAKLLVPRTVGYGAGLLNYFFRGELEVMDVGLIKIPAGDTPRVVQNQVAIRFAVSCDEISVYELHDNLYLFYDDYSLNRYNSRQPYGEPFYEKEIFEDRVQLTVSGYFNGSRLILVYHDPFNINSPVIGKMINIGTIVPTNAVVYKYGHGSDDSWAQAREEAHSDLLTREFWVRTSSGINYSAVTAIGRSHGDAGITDHYTAQQWIYRQYLNFNLSSTFYDDKVVNDIYLGSMIIKYSDQIFDLLIYKDNEKTWYPTWGCGDVLIYTINDYLSGIYEFDINDINTDNTNVLELRVGFNELDNHIFVEAPPPPVPPLSQNQMAETKGYFIYNSVLFILYSDE